MTAAGSIQRRSLLIRWGVFPRRRGCGSTPGAGGMDRRHLTPAIDERREGATSSALAMRAREFGARLVALMARTLPPPPVRAPSAVVFDSTLTRRRTWGLLTLDFGYRVATRPGEIRFPRITHTDAGGIYVHQQGRAGGLGCRCA
jgi:hypothetical protein